MDYLRIYYYVGFAMFALVATLQHLMIRKKNKLILMYEEMKILNDQIANSYEQYKSKAKEMIALQKEMIEKLRQKTLSSNGFDTFMTKMLEDSKSKIMNEIPKKFTTEIEHLKKMIDNESKLVGALLDQLTSSLEFTKKLMNEHPELQEKKIMNKFNAMRDNIVKCVTNQTYQAYLIRKEAMIQQGIWEHEKKDMLQSLIGDGKGIIAHIVMRDEGIDAFKKGEFKSIIEFIPSSIDDEIEFEFLQKSRDMIIMLADSPKIIDIPFDTLNEKNRNIRIAIEKIDAVTSQYKIMYK